MAMNDRRYIVQREDGESFCEEPHPVRLPRNPEHYLGEPWNRRVAIDTGKRGYHCPGGETHTYPCWVVFDENHPGDSNAGVFDVYMEAITERDRLNEKAKAKATS